MGKEAQQSMAFPPRPPRGRFIPRKEPEHRINNMIRVPEVRLVGDNVEVGVYPTQKALQIAQELGLDLVEISPQAVPPVCKAIDYLVVSAKIFTTILSVGSTSISG